jgi:hypothetical protein
MQARVSAVEVLESHGLIGSDDALPPVSQDAPRDARICSPELPDTRSVLAELRSRHRAAKAQLRQFVPMKVPQGLSAPREMAAVGPTAPHTDDLVVALMDRCAALRARVGPCGDSLAAATQALHEAVALLHPSGSEECAARIDAAMAVRMIIKDAIPSRADTASNKESSGDAAEALRTAVRLLKELSARMASLEELEVRMVTLQPVHALAVARADAVLRVPASTEATAALLQRVLAGSDTMARSVAESQVALTESLASLSHRLQRVKRAAQQEKR